MDIEEERKAFKLWFDDYSKDWPFRNPAILQTASEGYWDVWFAAKAHAEDMTKPAVKLSGFGIDPFKGIATFYVAGGEEFKFKLHTIGPMTKDKAIKWCAERGYRVIE